MNMTKADYDELVRLRNVYGCTKIRKQVAYVLMAENDRAYVFADLDHKIVKVGKPLNIAAAIAEYEREHKEEK